MHDAQLGQAASLADRLRQVSSCQVSDALAALGLPAQSVQGVVAPFAGAVVAGPAFTVTCLTADESQGRRLEYLGDIPEGAVVVIANGGRTNCSVWGGQRSVAARQRGAVGTVVDGAFRDVPEHQAMSYPVFARASTVLGSRGYADPVSIQDVVEVGGVRVSPGDLVLGDGSGVVVLPAAHAEEVLAIAEANAAEERQIAAAVEDGRDFFEARDAARRGDL
jgi:4-hydroxy-4-methyl-2-oxoglutarate aldolase